MDFTNEYLNFFKSILDETKNSTLYNDAMVYIEEQFSNYSISDNQKAELTINFMANITNATITTAMQVALSGVNTKLKAEEELKSLVLQNKKAELDIAIQEALKVLNETNVNLQNQKLQLDLATQEALKVLNEANINLQNQKLESDVVMQNELKVLNEANINLQNQKLELDIDIQAFLKGLNEANISLQNQKLSTEISINNTNNLLLDAQKATQLVQKDLIESEKLYKYKQTDMLTISNNDNKLIKALDSTSDMIGTIGAGGLVIPESLLNNYFTMVQKLLENEEITLAMDIAVDTKA